MFKLLFLLYAFWSITIAMSAAAPPKTPHSTPTSCTECCMLKDQIAQIKDFNTNLLKEVFVYRHVLNLKPKEVEEISQNLEKEIEAWVNEETIE